MPLPSSISDLSQTPASNYPPGSESPAILDDVQRSQASFIATLRDGKGFAVPVTLASAATTDIGGQNSLAVEITGTTTITSLGTTYNGPRMLRFTGALTLTHNATTLNLPTSANILTEAGDTCVALPNTSSNGWNIVSYMRASGVPVTQPSGRNCLINGGMQVDQRNGGAAQTITAGAALAYTVDRWYGYCTGANVTGQRVAGTAPNQYNYRFTGAASVTKIGFAQRIEAVNSQHLAGQNATLSIDLANSLLTTVTWTAWYANSTDTFGTLASPTRTQIATGTFTVTSTLTRYSVLIAAPSAATTGIEVEVSVGAQVSGTWTIGRAKFESGGVSTPFDFVQYTDTLLLCERYYWRSAPAGIFHTLGAAVVSGSSDVVGFSCPLPVRMRTTPTVAFTALRVSDGTTALSVLSIAAGWSGPDKIALDFTCSGAGLTTGRGAAVQYNNNSNAYIEASAEL